MALSPVPNKRVSASKFSVLACEQLMGKETAALWLQNLGPLLPKIDAFVKVIFTPEWVRITDFVTRFPEAVEEVMQKV